MKKGWGKGVNGGKKVLMVGMALYLLVYTVQKIFVHFKTVRIIAPTIYL